MGGFFALLSALGYSVFNILMRRGMMEENPGDIWDMRLIVSFFTLAFFLVGISAAAFLGFNVFLEFRELSLQALTLLVLSGIFGALIGALLLTSAVSQIGSSQASVLYGGSNPLIATLLGVFFLNENPGLIGTFSVFIIVAGIIIVGYHGHPETIMFLEKPKVAGGILALLAGFFFSLAQVSKGAALKMEGTPGTAFIIIQSMPFLSAAAFCYAKSKGFAYLKGISRKSLYCYAGAGMGIVGGAYFILTAFMFIPVWQTVAILSIQPLLTVLLSWIFLKRAERISWRLVSGAFLVTLGVVILNVY